MTITETINSFKGEIYKASNATKSKETIQISNHRTSAYILDISKKGFNSVKDFESLHVAIHNKDALMYTKLCEVIEK